MLSQLLALTIFISKACRAAPEDIVFCVHMSLVEDLRSRLESGEDPNDCDANGTYPLSLACRNGRTQIIELLLYHGANPNNCYVGEVSCLTYSVQYGRTDVTRKLLEARTCPDIPDTDGSTPIIHTVSLGRKLSFDLLVQFKANVNVYDRSGKSLLRIAAEKGHFELAQQLTHNHRQDPHQRWSVDGLNAIQAARHNGYNHLANALEYYSAYMSLTFSEMDPDSLFSTGLISDVTAAWRSSLLSEFISERDAHFQSTRCSTFIFAP